MSKICPYSMSGEPMECYGRDCMAWNEDECSVFKSESLSQYFMAKNMKKMADELHKITEELRWQR